MRNASTKNVLNDFVGLLISQTNTTIAESVLRAFKSLLVISISRKIGLLDTFGLSLSLSICNLSILQALHAITKSINGETVGVSLSSLGKIILFARPKLSDTGITFGGILNGFNLGELGINLINLSLKALRKSIGLSSRTNELKETIRILDTFSLCDSLQTLSVSILGLCLNIFSLDTLQSGLAKGRGTCHNVRHRIVLVRTLRRNRTTVSL